MGMFDTVRLKCPYCLETVEEQTKSGPCMLDVFEFPNVPISVMLGIQGPTVCDHCGSLFNVEMIQEPKFAIGKVRKGRK